MRRTSVGSRAGGPAPGVSDGRQHLRQQLSHAFQILCLRHGLRFVQRRGVRLAVPVRRGTRLLPVPGSSTHDAALELGCMGMVMSQWQWLRASLLRPVFSDPKSRATRAVARWNATRCRPPPACTADVPASVPRPRSCPPPGCSPPPPRRRWELPRCGKDGGRIHGRLRFLKADGVVIHQPQIGKAKTMHGARDGADVVGVARPHQHHGNPRALLFVSIALS